MSMISFRKVIIAFHHFRFKNRWVPDRYELSDISSTLCLIIISLLSLTAIIGLHLLTDVRSSCSAPRCNRHSDGTVTSESIVDVASALFQNDVNVSSTSSKSTHPPFDFTTHFLVNADHLCDARDGDDLNVTSLPLFLVIVHSRPNEIGQAQRDAIRATWGSNARKLIDDQISITDVRIVFVVGRPRRTPPDVLRKDPAEISVDAAADITKLRHESQLYGDLVVADLVDTYRKLTVKSLISMHWARTRCSSARYVVKVDDDVFLSVDLLPEVIQRISRRSSNDSEYHGLHDDEPGDVLVGSLNVNARVQRRGLWRVDQRVYAADRFPPYCSGNVYMMTSSAVDRLLTTAKADERLSTANPFPLEDVYVTSMLASRSGLQCRHDDAFPHWYTGPTGSNVQRMCDKRLIAVHNVDYQKMYLVNNKMAVMGCYR